MATLVAAGRTGGRAAGLLADRAAGRRPAPVGVVVAVAATTVVAVALVWRVRAPYPCCAAVAVALWAGTAGTPQDALAVIGVAELVALFSVAAHRPLDRALAAAGLFGIGSVVATLLSYGATGDAAGAIGLTTVSYLLMVGLGHSRQRWRLGRRQAAAALATARLAQQQAAARERHRLACELHDVSAHHLTAVVVTVTAARRLTASRPDLAGQALHPPRRRRRHRLGKRAGRRPGTCATARW
ncbi:histidine kinase [Solwaraspora sp. WMMA2101]|uniref:histidine kinase n=1 Tax=Solwaraspora sp. WMMA2101 TaxID=3404124 RepID=UPI003B9299C6